MLLYYFKACKNMVHLSRPCFAHPVPMWAEKASGTIGESCNVGDVVSVPTCPMLQGETLSSKDMMQGVIGILRWLQHQHFIFQCDQPSVSKK